MDIIKSKVIWHKTYRLISTRFPPIDLFERVADMDVWEDICNYESAHNPRVRNILFSHEESVYGAGASYVMAPFYYNFPPGRFTTSQFGGYYAAKKEITAIYEKAYHLGIFYRDSYEESGIIETCQMLVGKINASLCDLTGIPMNDDIYSPHSYEQSHKLALSLYNKGESGIVYNSVRDPGGLCFVAFKPKIIPPPIPGIKPALHWNGDRIDKWFGGETWNEIPETSR
jgi:hypothetical protein